MLCSCWRKYTKWLYKVGVEGEELFLCPSCMSLPWDEIKAKTKSLHQAVAMHHQGKTLEEIGKYLGVSRQRAHQIYKKYG